MPGDGTDCHLNVLEILLEDSLIDVSKKDNWGNSALKWGEEYELNQQCMTRGAENTALSAEDRLQRYKGPKRDEMENNMQACRKQIKEHSNMVLQYREIQKKLASYEEML